MAKLSSTERFRVEKFKNASGNVSCRVSGGYRPDGKVATRNGTSDGMVTLHYRDEVENPHHAKEYWALIPEVVKDVKLKSGLPARHSVPWPTEAELKKLAWEKPLSQLAKDIGASGTAIRKRCISRGIKLPKNGHWQRERMKAKA